MLQRVCVCVCVSRNIRIGAGVLRGGVWCPYLHELRVDLEVGLRLVLLQGGAAALLDAGEQVLHGAGDDARLLRRLVHVEARAHRVRLARPSLKDASKTRGENRSHFQNVIVATSSYPPSTRDA